MARIRIAKATSGAAFVNKKKATEARLAAVESGLEVDDGPEDIFELQHHHLLRCLEKTTVSFQYLFLLSFSILSLSLFITFNPDTVHKALQSSFDSVSRCSHPNKIETFPLFLFILNPTYAILFIFVRNISFQFKRCFHPLSFSLINMLALALSLRIENS